MGKKSVYISRITNSFTFSLGMLKHLPSLFFWGVKVKALDEKNSTVLIKHGWSNKNPFGSIYFSALTGAAELSTGILVQLHIQNDNAYSMLVVASSANFLKKAKGTISFTCSQGDLVKDTIASLTESSPTASFTLDSAATDETGTIIGTFTYTWSVKKK
jgi:Domain of unknown function (DUF4442)